MNVFIAKLLCFLTSVWVLPLKAGQITALIASLVPWECRQPIISKQEDKQGIKFNEGAMKCCKEKKLLLLLMSGKTFNCLYCPRTCRCWTAKLTLKFLPHLPSLYLNQSNISSYFTVICKIIFVWLQCYRTTSFLGWTHKKM